MNIKTNPEVLRIQREVQKVEAAIKQLAGVVEKLNTLSQKISVTQQMPINSVCSMEVELRHTSEITVALGGDFFALMVKDKAINVANRRLESMNANLRMLKRMLEAAKQKKDMVEQQQTPVSSEETRKNQKVLLECDDNGQEIFEIRQYTSNRSQVRQIREQLPLKQGSPQQINKFLTKTLEQPPKQPQVPKPQVQKQQVEVAAQPPKKLSKFKEQKMKQKQQRQ